MTLGIALVLLFYVMSYLRPYLGQTSYSVLALYSPVALSAHHSYSYALSYCIPRIDIVWFPSNHCLLTCPQGHPQQSTLVLVLETSLVGLPSQLSPIALVTSSYFVSILRPTPFFLFRPIPTISDF